MSIEVPGHTWPCIGHALSGTGHDPWGPRKEGSRGAWADTGARLRLPIKSPAGRGHPSILPVRISCWVLSLGDLPGDHPNRTRGQILAAFLVLRWADRIHSGAVV